MAPRRRRYSEEEKEAAVKLAVATTVRAAAAELDIPFGTLAQWAAHASRGPATAPAELSDAPAFASPAYLEWLLRRSHAALDQLQSENRREVAQQMRTSLEIRNQLVAELAASDTQPDVLEPAEAHRRACEALRKHPTHRENMDYAEILLLKVGQGNMRDLIAKHYPPLRLVEDDE